MALRNDLNTPAWYEGSTPWIDLSPAERLFEAIEVHDEDVTIEAAMGAAGFALTDSRHYAAVAAVLNFAGRNLDGDELEDAVDWLKEGGYIESATQPASATAE